MLFDGLRLCKFFSFPSFFYRAVADSGPLTLGGAEHSRVVDFMLFGRETLSPQGVSSAEALSSWQECTVRKHLQLGSQRTSPPMPNRRLLSHGYAFPCLSGL